MFPQMFLGPSNYLSGMLEIHNLLFPSIKRYSFFWQSVALNTQCVMLYIF